MYQDFRVIGTTPGMFNDLTYGGKKYEFAEGRNFEPDEYYGGVIGATVARETGLKVGDTFQPSHGAGPDAHQHDPFKIVGILKPTGTPNDRGLFINMEGFYLIPEHAKPVDDEPPWPRTTCTSDEHEHGDARRRTHAEQSKHADRKARPRQTHAGANRRNMSRTKHADHHDDDRATNDADDDEHERP